MIDENTPRPFSNKGLKTTDSKNAQIDDHIYMDATAFGLGNSCLQVTFQACSIDEARHLYDQMIPMAPIMLAISAASPIFRGLLAEVDTRWSVISAANDDRTEKEKAKATLKYDSFYIPKSRYASCSSYLSNKNEEYNDIKLVIDEKARKKLVDAGMEYALANHFAHLFIREPIYLLRNKYVFGDISDSLFYNYFIESNSTMKRTPITLSASSQQIGRRFDSSLRLQLTPRSAGGSSSGRWKFSLLNSKTRRFQSLLFFSIELF